MLVLAILTFTLLYGDEVVGQISSCGRPCMLPCQHGFKVDFLGCIQCECRTDPCKFKSCPGEGSICVASTRHCQKGQFCFSRAECKAPATMCELPAEAGTCDERLPRFYYDTNRKKCAPFTWTGCGGNDNHFRSMQECKTTCEDFQTGFTCPAVLPWGQSVRCTNRNSRCISDTDCPGKKMCCYNGCRHECTNPVRHPAKGNRDNEGEDRDGSDNENEEPTPPGGNPTLPDDRDGDQCPDFRCDLNCRFGLKRDENKCRICECAPNPCSTVLCQSENICFSREVCQTENEELRCHYTSAKCIPASAKRRKCEAQCDRSCRKGIELSTTVSCPQCTCPEDLCELMTCQPGYRCTLKRKCHSKNGRRSCAEQPKCVKQRD